MADFNVDKLGGIVLPWAKERHPDKYAATLKVAKEPATFRNYLLRLLEIRWAEDTDARAEWKLDVELSMLEETAIQQAIVFRGHDLTFAGKKVEGRVWSFAELRALVEAGDDGAELERLRRVKDALDLEIVSVSTESTT
jgi:hypothetical protein